MMAATFELYELLFGIDMFLRGKEGFTELGTFNAIIVHMLDSIL